MVSKGLDSHISLDDIHCFLGSHITMVKFNLRHNTYAPNQERMKMNTGKKISVIRNKKSSSANELICIQLAAYNHS